MAPPMRLMLAIVATLLLLLPGAAADCAALQPTSQPVTAPGVEYKVLANGLQSPRGIIIDSLGNLLVVEKNGGIQRIVLDGGDGLGVCVRSKSRIVSDKSLTHGIALSADGKTLFASSSNAVFAYTYDAAKGTISRARSVITGMDTTDHVTRTLLIPRHNPKLLLVSRGSADNIDNATMELQSGRSQIRTFDLEALLAASNAVPYTNGAVLGWGLRNSVGVADHPVSGNIWSVENSIDNMKRFGRDIHNTNPGEELNFHGLPNDTSSDLYGKNFGYPQCVAIFDPSNIDNYPGGAAVGKQMTGDHTAPGVTDDYCLNDVVPPRITFGSHLAPLDIKFQQDGAGAFVSMHGSWNRQPPNGYRLSRVDFGADGFPLESPTSTKAEVRLMWNADNSKCPGKCFRPVGLAVDEGAGEGAGAGGHKRLWMTSDASGEVFVLTGVHKDGSAAAAPQHRLNLGYFGWTLQGMKSEACTTFC